MQSTNGEHLPPALPAAETFEGAVIFGDAGTILIAGQLAEQRT